MKLMSVCDIKGVFDFGSAIFGLAASIMWFAAALAPVGVPGPGAWMPDDRNHPIWKEIETHGRNILRGAQLNKWAAGLTGGSALCTFLSWSVTRFFC